MARGKNSRRRASLDGAAPPKLTRQNSPNSVVTITTADGDTTYSGGSVTTTPAAGGSSGASMLPMSREEVVDAIEFHWKNLSLDLKKFLLGNPRDLSLQKFVEYWTAPHRIDNTSPNIAASICGCSWYLALNYMNIGCAVEARALVLNGCFLQQCYVS